jgi:hypothetical protein
VVLPVVYVIAQREGGAGLIEGTPRRPPRSTLASCGIARDKHHSPFGKEKFNYPERAVVLRAEPVYREPGKGCGNWRVAEAGADRCALDSACCALGRGLSRRPTDPAWTEQPSRPAAPPQPADPRRCTLKVAGPLSAAYPSDFSAVLGYLGGPSPSAGRWPIN